MYLYIGVELEAARLGASPPRPPRRGGTHVDEIHACLSPLGRLAEGGLASQLTQAQGMKFDAVNELPPLTPGNPEGALD